MRVLAVVLLLASAACQSVTVSSATVGLDEFSVTPSASSFQAGDVELTVRNTGNFGHTLVVTDSEGNVVRAGEMLGPSEEATLRLDLKPGEYQFTCRIVGQDGGGHIIDHYEEGMVAKVTVERS